MSKANDLPARDVLLSEIEAFLSKTGMPATSFGEQLMNDRHLVRRLRAGRDVRLGTAERIRQFIRSHGQKKVKTAEFLATG